MVWRNTIPQMQVKKNIKKTDAFRRKATRMFIKMVESVWKRKSNRSFDRNKVRRILVCRPNHRLGNQLLVTPLVCELEQVFPEAKIELFLKGDVGKEIFSNYDSVVEILRLPKTHFRDLIRYFGVWLSLTTRKYDIVVNVDEASSSGRLATVLAGAKYRYDSCQEIQISSNFHHMAKKPIYFLRAFLRENNIDRMSAPPPPLNLKLSDLERIKAVERLRQMFNNEKPVIGIFTHATGKKCYSSEQWNSFYDDLNHKFGQKYNILEVLPFENTSQINFRSLHFYSRDIRELAGTIDAMTLFISADCGMMHLACATMTPVIGLFKFTNIRKYEPYANDGIGILSQDMEPDRILKYVELLALKSKK